jgi:hypothetical protein
MSLVKKDVTYLNKDFAQFRQNLINFTKTYFPNTYGDFNETSPGMLFMEMASYVGDVLSFYTDTSFRESIISSARERRNIMELSHLFGYKPRNRTAATCTVSIYHLVNSIGTGAATEPDMRQALVLDSGAEVLTDNGTVFRTIETVDFQNNPEITVYDLDSNGDPANYLLKKYVQVVSGEVETLDYVFNNPKPYDKIVIPNENVLDIISITDSAGNTWREVDYLAQDTVFDDVLNIPFNDPTLSQFRSSVPYILKLRKTPRRFITKRREDGRIEVQFGSGVSSDADEEIVPNPKNVGIGLEYLRRETLNNLDPSNFLYTSTYGLAPNNTTLTVTYSIGGGLDDNAGVNTINRFQSFNVLNESYDDINFDLISDTLAVINEEPATGGNDFSDIEHIRQNAMASFAAQNRAITREDYISRIYSMPQKYGSIEKAFVIGDDQINTSDMSYPSYTIQNPLALNVYVLSYDENQNLVPANQALKENLRTYLSEYRMLTDALNIKDAFIINIAVDFEITCRPTYNNTETILRCIERLKFLMSNERMQINGSIDINALKADLDRVEGVQTVNDLSISNRYSTAQGYSGNVYDITSATRNGIIYPSLDPCIFEIKYPNRDIKGRTIGS